jgi:glycosyltransferase involved in cell wall biosynthesis
MQAKIRSRNFLFISDNFFPDTTGGSQRVVYNHALHFSKSGAHTTILTENTGSLSPCETIDNMKVIRYENTGKNVFTFNYFRARNAARSLSLFIKERPETTAIFFNHIISSSIAIFNPILHKKNIKKVYVFHGPYDREVAILLKKKSESKRKYLQVPYKIWAAIFVFILNRLQKKILNKSDSIVTLSQFMATQIHDLYGGQFTHKISVIPGGVNTHQFKYSPIKSETESRPVLFFTARRLAPRMGIKECIDVFNNIHMNFSKNFIFNIAGKGPMRDELFDYIKSLNLQGNIKLLGFITEDELVKSYNESDFFLLPTTDQEGFGLVTVEALSSGLPVIALPNGATPEIISAVCPELEVKKNNFDCFQEKIEFLISNPQKYKEISYKKSLRAKVSKLYNWDIACQKLAMLVCK